MSDVIYGELLFFLISISTGVLILFCYDLLRAFRRVYAHGAVLLAVEDFLYWSIAGVTAFGVIFAKNSGMLRGFSLVAMLIGMMLYHKSISRLVIKVVSAVLSLIKKVIEAILRVLTFPFHFVSKKLRRKDLKRLKNWIKEVKMTICKK